MAQIFTIEHEVPAPQFDFKTDKNFAGYQARVDVYLEDVKNKLKEYKYGQSPLFGEIISFSVADGYAQYMVVSSRPLRLLHLPIGDAWEYIGIERLRLVDVENKVNAQKTLAKLFPPKI